MQVGQTIGSGADRFELTGELGSGAMGTVYKAVFHHDGKAAEVALKVVAPGLLGNEGAMARFDREANILKQLRHPHIVRLYATGRYKKTPFIAMEFVDGEPLDRALARRGKLAWEEVAAYGRQLADALQHAHDKGIIHRDLKPSNLLITPGGTLKLTDFGIAKDTDLTALTRANSTIGTAAYMSPEQCKGERNLTPKSDLYSLGVVFFELLSGRKPFAAETTVEMFMKHVHEPPPRVGRVVPGLPPKFEALILQLLEKDPADRPTDAAWVGRMLREVEEDEFARQSAGLAAATGRGGVRKKGSGDRPLSDADREALRALRGGKKKKRKAAAVAWWERPWVKGAGLLLALGGLGGLAYALTRPPSAAALAAAVENAPTPEAKLAAAEAYLKRYGDVPGGATDAAAAAFRDGKARERESQLAKRFALPKLRAAPDEGDEPQSYATAMLAIEAEGDGRLADAALLWQKVERQLPDEAKAAFTLDPARQRNAGLAWAAAKRCRDIKAVPGKLAELDRRLADNERYETPAPGTPDDPEALALKARRLERLGDWEKAGRTWEAAAGLAERDPDRHVLYLLARDHKREAEGKKRPADPADGRREAVAAAVARAEGRAAQLRSPRPDVVVQRADWVLLRLGLREVVELYGDEADPPLAEAVGRARKLLDAVAKEGG